MTTFTWQCGCRLEYPPGDFTTCDEHTFEDRPTGDAPPREMVAKADMEAARTAIREDLIGRTVTHGNLTGKVTAVTAEFISIEGSPGMVVKVPVPEHLRSALESES